MFQRQNKNLRKLFLFRNAGTMICTQFNAALSRSSALTHTHTKRMYLLHTLTYTQLFLLHSHTQTHTHTNMYVQLLLFSRIIHE